MGETAVNKKPASGNGRLKKRGILTLIWVVGAVLVAGLVVFIF